MLSQIIVNIFIAFSIYLLLGFSLFLIYSTTKFFNLAHAITLSTGPYFTYQLLQISTLPVWFLIIISIILSLIISLLIELLIYKPLRKKRTSSLIMLIASLGIYIVLQNCISLIWGDDVKIIRLENLKISNKIAGAFITDVQIWTIIISLLLFFSGVFFLKFHKIGRDIRAFSADSELATIIGINPSKIILLSSIISSGMVAISGILISFDAGLTPNMGFKYLLYGVIVMIVGGIDSIWGLIVGAFLLATAQNLTAFYLESKWIDSITLLLLIVFLIWKPLGVSGKRLRKIEI